MVSGAICQKCGSQQVRPLWRNGHYQRGLDTHWGQLTIAMPQVRCRSGGSVRIPWQTLRTGQRIWEELAWAMQAEYGGGLRLRWIKAKADGKLGGSLGLCTLNERVQQAGAGLAEWRARPLKQFPPIVEVDGIWITAQRTDRWGRLRAVKRGQRYVILLARGCWPQTGQHTLLTWLVTDKESEQNSTAPSAFLQSTDDGSNLL